MSDPPENAGPNSGPKRKTTFQPGRSGNPKGKPRGTRHRATQAVELLLQGEAEALTRKAVELALAGDTTALRLCLERLSPPRKERSLSIDVGPLTTTADIASARRRIVVALARGEILPTEAAALGSHLDALMQVHEVEAMADRLSHLESQLHTKGS